MQMSKEERLEQLGETLLNALNGLNGKGRAVTAQHLCFWFGFKHDAEVREVVHALREKGELIGSCAQGYYMMTTPEEVAEVVDALWGRIGAIVKVADALELRKRSMGVPLA